MNELCECCGQPGGVCRSCGREHSPAINGECEQCHEAAKTRELVDALDKERALGDALAMALKREKRQVYDRVQATGVPHALHGCCCPWCHIDRLLDLYEDARKEALAKVQPKGEHHHDMGDWCPWCGSYGCCSECCPCQTENKP